MSKKRFMSLVSIFALVITLVLPVSPVAAEDTGSTNDDFTLNIMHMNDTHARVEEYPKMIAAITDYRYDHKDALLFHAGDVFSGTLYYNVHKGQADITLMNLMGIDAFTFGNHEFDEGSVEEHHETLAKFISKANFPALGTNIDFSQDDAMAPLVSSDAFVEDAEAGKVYDGIIKEVNGEKIGIFGLTTEDTINVASPNHVTFKNYIDSAKRAVKEFEDLGINKIIAVTHIGYNTGTAEIGNDLLLAKHVEGIDVIVGGHSHTKLEAPVVIDKDANGEEKDPTVIVQANQYAEFLGTLEVSFDDEGVVTDFAGELIKTDNYENTQDAVGTRLLKEFKKEVDELANQETNAIVAKDLLNPRFSDGDETSVRASETELGNLITDAMLYGAKQKFEEIEIALQNGGGIRAPISAGNVTNGEIISVLPFGNDPVRMELTGAEIKEALEHSVRLAPGENGGFLHVAGMKFEFDSSLEVGDRVVSMHVKRGEDWEEIDLESVYHVTTNSFTGGGGDGFDVFKRAFDAGKVVDMGEIDWEQLVRYMEFLTERDGAVDPVIEGRIIDLALVDEDPEEPGDGEDNDGEGNDGEGNDGEGNDGEGNDGEGNDGEGNDGEGNNGEGNDGEGNDGEGNDGEGNNGEGNNGEGNNGEGNGKTNEKDEDGKDLPKTATNMYNYLLIGGLLLAGGAGVFVYRRLVV